MRLITSFFVWALQALAGSAFGKARSAASDLEQVLAHDHRPRVAARGGARQLRGHRARHHVRNHELLRLRARGHAADVVRLRVIRGEIADLLLEAWPAAAGEPARLAHLAT